jgi:seryl-tRNA synthetase
VGTIIALYQKENRHLKEKIVQLEAKIDRLIADKEQMLRDERDRIEQVYSNKDEQLKNILELINTKLMLTQKSEVHDVDVHDDEPIEASWDQRDFVELRHYLKSLDIKSAERKMIRRRFAEAFGSDVRIIQQNGQFFLDFSKYDYSDLLKH